MNNEATGYRNRPFLAPYELIVPALHDPLWFFPMPQVASLHTCTHHIHLICTSPELASSMALFSPVLDPVQPALTSPDVHSLSAAQGGHSATTAGAIV